MTPDYARAAAEAIYEGDVSSGTLASVDDMTDLIQRLAINPAVDAARREGAEAMRLHLVSNAYRLPTVLTADGWTDFINYLAKSLPIPTDSDDGGEADD